MAIIDWREIAFEADAVRRAIACSPGGADALGLPSLNPDTVAFDPAGEAVTVFFVSAAGTLSATLRAEVLGALLMSYALRLRIPIPRQVRKTVTVTAQAVLLRFQRRLDPAPAPMLPEPARPAAPVRALTW